MSNCKDCIHWKREGQSCSSPFDGGNEETEEVDLGRIGAFGNLSYELGVCDQPKLVKFRAPDDSSGLAVMDGSYYRAQLLTGEDFGCVNFEKGKL